MGAARAFYEKTIDYTGSECLPWPFATDEKGYPTLKQGKRTRRVHTLHCERIHGPRPTPKHEVGHSCGRGMHKCANPNHVKGWVTRAENEADKKIHGSLKNRSLTWELVEALREAGKHLPPEFLAISVNLTTYSVRRILKHQSWRLDGQPANNAI